MKNDYKKGLGVGLTFCFRAVPMILNDVEDDQDTIDFATVDFSNDESREQFGDTVQRRFQTIVTRNAYVKRRLQGILEDLMEADIF